MDETCTAASSTPFEGVYGLRLDEFARGMFIASLGPVASTVPSPTLLNLPRRGGGEVAATFNLFHGPGESPDKRGLGKGEISPMALITGLGIALLVPLMDPKALFKAAFRLGVLDMAYKLPVDVFRFSGVYILEGERFVLSLGDSRCESGGESAIGAVRSVSIRKSDVGMLSSENVGV